jgi:hypothetical protein
MEKEFNRTKKQSIHQTMKINVQREESSTMNQAEKRSMKMIGEENTAEKNG